MDATAARVYGDVMMVDPPATTTPAEEAELDYLFGELWPDPSLGRRERRLVTLTCAGYAITPQPILEHAYAALKSGDFTIQELLEAVLHFAVYCGWPKASNLEMYVRQAWTQVQQERGEDATLPTLGVEDLGENDWAKRLDRGGQEFADVNLVSIGNRADTPYQHAGILNFVFGHVWQRPGLGRRDRRFVTVASVGLCQAPIPIESHVGSALKSGQISKTEMDELIRHFSAYAGAALAAPLQAAADKSWAEHQAARGR